MLHPPQKWSSSAATVLDKLLASKSLMRGCFPGELRGQAYDLGPLYLPMLLEASAASETNDINHFFYVATRPRVSSSSRAHCFHNSFISPFDMKLLVEQCGQWDPGAVSKLPLRFSAKFVHVDGGLKVTRALRRRYRVLRHLPVASEVSLCSTDIWHQKALISDAVRVKFKSERKRMLRERASDIARRKRKEENWELLVAERTAEEEAATLREIEASYRDRDDELDAKAVADSFSATAQEIHWPGLAQDPNAKRIDNGRRFAADVDGSQAAYTFEEFVEHYHIQGDCSIEEVQVLWATSPVYVKASGQTGTAEDDNPDAASVDSPSDTAESFLAKARGARPVDMSAFPSLSSSAPGPEFVGTRTTAWGDGPASPGDVRQHSQETEGPVIIPVRLRGSKKKRRHKGTVLLGGASHRQS